MTGIIYKNFDNSALEADIQKLSKEIADKKQLPEHKDLTERDIIKRIIQPIVKQSSVSRQPAVSDQQSNIQSQILPDYLKDSPADIKIQIENLISLAIHQGIEKAAKEANKFSAFIVDAFHDAITDKLYDELKNRKLL